MHTTVRKKNNKTKNNKIKNNKIKKKKRRRRLFTVVFLACILASMSIINSGKQTSSTQKNGLASDIKKVEETQNNASSYNNNLDKNDNASWSDGNIRNLVRNKITNGANESAANSVKSNNIVAADKPINIGNVQVSLKGRNQINGQGVDVEQAFVNNGKKTAFLTFDDGPSVTVTPRILDTLNQYKVNATFFLVGSCIESNSESKEILKRAFKEGNAFGNHTYTHNLKLLYPHNKVDVNYFMQEVDKTNNILRDILGYDFYTRIIRMPGGYMSRQYYKDTNLTAFNDKIKECKMFSIDWNAYDADAEGRKKSAEQLLNEVKKSVANQEKVVILMQQ